MSSTPIVLEHINLPGFLQNILEQHTSPSTIIVCSTKAAFLQQLREATSTPTSAPAETTFSTPNLPTNPWQRPTLRLLASTRTLTLAFCPTLPHLRAYLASFPYRTPRELQVDAPSSDTTDDSAILALLNPLTLHRETSAFSVQGLNRTFAVAVEAAFAAKCRLAVAECDAGEGVGGQPEGEETGAGLAEGSPWDEEVSILNVTTKSFGVGERGWAGRMVRVRTVLGRWFRFERLEREPGEGGG